MHYIILSLYSFLFSQALDKSIHVTVRSTKSIVVTFSLFSPYTHRQKCYIFFLLSSLSHTSLIILHVTTYKPPIYIYTIKNKNNKIHSCVYLHYLFTHILNEIKI